jgi:hypothetical protein
MECHGTTHVAQDVMACRGDRRAIKPPRGIDDGESRPWTWLVLRVAIVRVWRLRNSGSQGIAQL